ncbi:MAG: hypothetical protein WCI75_11220, partial [candidate division NC10 bacterium]
MTQAQTKKPLGICETVLRDSHQSLLATRMRTEDMIPAMELLEKEQIAEWEPAVALVDGVLRPEEIVAIGIRNSPTAVDYEALTESF